MGSILEKHPRGFRVGKVTAYLRGRVWYLRYHEQGRRRQVRAVSDRAATKQLAAQVNAQLEAGAPACTSFEPLPVEELRRRWLEHHEAVLRSSVATIDRYRTATDHLLRFVQHQCPVRHASHITAAHAEQFVRHLRQLEVAPNGHAHCPRRKLRDKGIKYVLETCRALFNFAARRRHLPPYTENPFSMIEIDRIPVEDAKPVELMEADEERGLFERLDPWQAPIFFTLALTGLRPGELTHLLLPDDLDLTGGWLYVRNKPALCWSVKTRSERRVPLAAELIELLRRHVGSRATGPVFFRRRFCGTRADPPALGGLSSEQLAQELVARNQSLAARLVRATGRAELSRLAKGLWRDAGAIKPERLRIDFMRLTGGIGRDDLTAPKLFRHAFATALQDSNVDVLIRNQVMGHAPASGPSGPSSRNRASGGLGMTGVYTHTRESTLRTQVLAALAPTEALAALQRYLRLSATSDPVASGA